MGAAEKMDLDQGRAKRVRVETKVLPWMDKRLEQWAECVPSASDGLGGSGGSGYGNSALASIIDAKGDVVRSTGGGVAGEMPDSVYEIHKAMRKLAVSDKALHAALCEHYQHADADEAVRVMRCGCSRRTYFRRVAMGHHAVAYLLPGHKSSGVGRAVQAVKTGARDALLKNIKKPVDVMVALN